MGETQRTNSKNKNSLKLPKTIVIGTLITVAVYFAFIAICALISLKAGIGDSTYMPVGVVLGILSGLIGGFTAVRPVKQNGFALGVVSGVSSSLICAAIHFVVNGNKAGNGLLVLMAAIIFGSILGGISAVNLKFKKKY